MYVTDSNDDDTASTPREPSTPVPPHLEIPRYRASKTLQQRVLVAVITALALSATILLSPILLATVRDLFSTDWATLSEVGQSYTGVATLFSVAALLGAVVAIRLQVRQSQVAQEQALRGTQFQLLAMALHDSDLLRVVSLAVPDEADDDLRRQHVFLTMVLRHFQFVHLTNNLPDSNLEAMLRSEFFSNKAAREHWSRVRQQWAFSVTNTPERTFVMAAERAWRTPDAR